MSKEFKPYVEKNNNFWWLTNRRYFTYAMREISGLVMSLYVLISIYEISQLTSGSSSFIDFRLLAASPLMFMFSVIALAFTLLHTITWFELTGKIQKDQVPKISGKSPPIFALVIVNMLILFAASYLIYFLFW